MTSINIGERRVGHGEPAYLIAELSGNHNGDRSRAVETIHAASEAGADAIKLQTYTPDTMTIESDRPEFIVPGDGPWAGRSLYDLYGEAHTPWDWHAELFEAARVAGIHMFSTPFDATAVEFLEELGAPAYKIASFELIDDPLLKRVAQTGKPVIMSTGMANLEEIAHAVSVLRRHGTEQLVLLRCTSAYPAPDADMNLNTIPFLQQVFDCPVGLSDHSLGTVAPVAAVTLGACLVEKHFTLARADGGVDSHFSVEPEEFAQIVREVRRAERMTGRPMLVPGTAESETTIFRRSLYVVADLRAGDRLTAENLRSIRPGFGLPPKFYDDLIGRRVARDVPRGTPAMWELLSSHADDG